eukprot:760621-Hanusia_phi.AAC.1
MNSDASLLPGLSLYITSLSSTLTSVQPKLNGLDHAGTSSTDEVGTIGMGNLGGGGEEVDHLHNGGTSVYGFIHDFGHNHIDNVVGSDVHGADGEYGNGDDINQGNWFEHSQYLRTDQVRFHAIHCWCRNARLFRSRLMTSSSEDAYISERSLAGSCDGCFRACTVTMPSTPCGPTPPAWTTSDSSTAALRVSRG